MKPTGGIDMTEEEFEELKSKAEAGKDKEAMYQLAEAYCDMKKYDEAANWFMAAGRRKHAMAEARMGDMYRLGLGGKLSNPHAYQWYMKSALQGCPYGCMRLAYCYIEKIGTNRDEEKAFKLFKYAAEHGNGEAQGKYGEYFLNGEFVEKDEAAAFEWFKKAAENNSETVWANLGYCYATGTCTEVDKQKAFECYLRGARNGEPWAAANLGMYYLNGTCVRKSVTKALKCFRYAAYGSKERVPMAMYFLGYTYEFGIGVQMSYSAALKWYRKASQEGDEMADYALGRMYMEGKGVTPSELYAWRYFRKAQDGGCEAAQEMLDKLR